MQITLKQLRIALNVSQTELAAKVGISRIHINRIEQNKSLPSGPVLRRICRVLNVCPYRLINFCTNCPLDSCHNDRFFLPIK